MPYRQPAVGGIACALINKLFSDFRGGTEGRLPHRPGYSSQFDMSHFQLREGCVCAVRGALLSRLAKDGESHSSCRKT
jgi:hypothetical protein